ncbi:glycoside hydrolase family 13 protein [Deinococcus budaensis]|uniref:Oligo-1,6-glucosidase n=1 Tax=Deinococcus budaensis TaxID=1665626 RepID=A0A7W8LQ18_9DEIO|nr:alpha-glucosidase [Deinococcus budaensis]MBB5234140.1 oligo-1,6-glucosidase [Deinococcus budaensis]
MWWKESVVYQIYPRSFRDSNGDGIGDLRGITGKLDYLQQLGVDVLWLCPIYDSPNDDGGYDIRDYCAILPEFGTMRDFDDLLADVHARGMKLIMDLVVNHTSDEHPWFQAARSSRDSLFRDYYIWRPGRHGGPPNNWASHFGGSAWTYDETTDEYYLHLFSTRQPDLNWENPRVREDIYAMMRFWLEKGVDGWRMDTINMLSKPPELPDAAPRAGQAYILAEEHFLNGPRLMEYLREMRDRVLSPYDVLTVGETPGVTPELGAAYTHETEGVLSMLFQFEHMGLDSDPTHPTPKWTKVPWALSDLKRITTRWQQALHGQGWNSLYLSNHDVPRLVSRFGDDGAYRVPSAKLLATFLHTLQGTPYVYQGDEIGMTNVQFSRIEEYRDIDALNHYQEQVVERHRDPAEVLRDIHAKGRDNARTPMHWDASPHAGFTTGTPWIGVNPNHTEINVEAALRDPDSIFWYVRDLIRLRRTHRVMVDGRYDLHLPDHPSIYAYTRTDEHQQMLVVLNFSAAPVVVDVPQEVRRPATRLLLANYLAPGHLEPTLELRAFEARVYLTSLEPRHSTGDDGAQDLPDALVRLPGGSSHDQRSLSAGWQASKCGVRAAVSWNRSDSGGVK